MSETQKAHSRRLREGWYDKYCPSDKSGLDIGCQRDPVNNTFRRWDVIFGDGDGAVLEGIPNETYFTIYASHVLEHVDNPVAAVRRWWQVLKPQGHLIVCVPHRDMYEKKKKLPSHWNQEHKHYFLPETAEDPCTLSLKSVIEQAITSPYTFKEFRILDEGFEYHGDLKHSSGEYSIEAVVCKS